MSSKSYSCFFCKNIRVYAIFNDQSFNDMLTNNILSLNNWVLIRAFAIPIMAYDFCSYNISSLYLPSSNIVKESIDLLYSYIHQFYCARVLVLWTLLFSLLFTDALKWHQILIFSVLHTAYWSSKMKVTTGSENVFSRNYAKITIKFILFFFLFLFFFSIYWLAL